MTFLDGFSVTPSTYAIDIANKSLTNVLNQNLTSCTTTDSSFTVQQSICNPPIVKRSLDSAPVAFIENVSAVACSSGEVAIQQALSLRYNYAQALSVNNAEVWARYPALNATLSKNNIDGTVPNDEINEIKLTVCAPVARACVMEQNVQSISTSMESSCIATNTTEIDIKKKVSDDVTQTFTKNDDFLSSLADIFPGQSAQQIATQVANTITENITDNNLQQIMTNMTSLQTMEVGSDGHTYSVWFKGNSQNLILDSISKSVKEANIFQKSLTDLLNKVDQDTLLENDSIGDIIRALNSALNCVAKAEAAAVIVITIILVVLMGVWAGMSYGLITRSQKTTSDAANYVGDLSKLPPLQIKIVS